MILITKKEFTKSIKDYMKEIIQTSKEPLHCDVLDRIKEVMETNVENWGYDYNAEHGGSAILIATSNNEIDEFISAAKSYLEKYNVDLPAIYEFKETISSNSEYTEVLIMITDEIAITLFYPSSYNTSEIIKEI